VQFARFVGNAVQGEFGLSLRQGRKVSTLIAERFPATLELALAAAVIALNISTIPRRTTSGENFDGHHHLDQP
jgi:ABC-type dipeptide/oligopeptide/nickel transport system permease component